MNTSMKSLGSKRILFVSPLPPPAGGIATWTKLLLENGLADDYEIRIVNTRILGSRKLFDKQKALLIEVFRNFKIVLNLLKCLLIYRPHLVHINCSLSNAGVFRDALSACMIKIFTRCKLVVHYRGNIPDFEFHSMKGLSGMALRKLFFLADVNVSINKPSLDFLEKNALDGKYQSKNVLLSNFIDVQKVKFNERLKKDNFRCRIIYAGGITKKKGCNEIVALANRIPDVDFVLIGEVKPDFATQHNELPKNIKLIPQSNMERVLQELFDSDIFLFPSYSEGFPNVVLEAMAVGLPIVASKTGAIPEMIEEPKGGRLAVPGDIDTLEKILTQLITHPQARNEMGKFNRNKVLTQYSYPVVIKQLIAIYDHLLGGSKCVE